MVSILPLVGWLHTCNQTRKNSHVIFHPRTHITVDFLGDDDEDDDNERLFLWTQSPHQTSCSIKKTWLNQIYQNYACPVTQQGFASSGRRHGWLLLVTGSVRSCCWCVLDRELNIGCGRHSWFNQICCGHESRVMSSGWKLRPSELHHGAKW